MRSPFHRRRFDSAAKVLVGVSSGLGRLGTYSGAPSPMAGAIAVAENAPQSTNNPGDLELGDIGYGTYQAAGGQQITIFPSLDAGWAALQNQINLIASGQSSAGYNPSMSIAQVGAIYSGDSSGAWANNVASSLGIDPSTNFVAAAGGATGSADATIPASDITVSDEGGILSDLTSGNMPYYIAAGLAAAATLWAATS